MGRRSIRAVLPLVVLAAGCGRATPRPPSAPGPGPEALLEPSAVRSLMMRGADWQLANPSRHPPHDWTQAVFYAGLLALADIAEDPRYYAAARSAGERNRFRPGPRRGHADDQAVTQLYLGLHLRERDARMIAPTLALLDELAARPLDEPLPWSPGIAERAWAWCDALFMAPPAWALAATATGERRYLDVMDRLWWKTADFLYDRAESLFFRDSRAFDAREKNGRKVFWSRGNGWVMAGLVRILEHLPEDHPARPRYLALYRAMAAKVAQLQRPDGFWRASLLDPESHPGPESSGTALFTYALAWGINHGVLDRDPYEPVVRRAWLALARAVDAEGRLGWVQAIGDRPAPVTRESTEVYGVGALLLAGSEVFRLTLFEGSRAVVVVAHNPLAEPRVSETVEVPFAPIAAGLEIVPGDPLVVVDERSGMFLPAQRYDEDGAPETLLASASFLAGDTRRLVVRRLARPFRTPTPRLRAQARFFPENEDDFAWENDRIAFRTYGPALEARGAQISSGIDVWAKRVRPPVLDGWYGQASAPERGLGLDVYDVGPSRGCGGVGMWHKDRLHVSRNFRRWRLLANGPVRVAFELGYERWGPDGLEVDERKHIRLDLGQNLSRIESRFGVEGQPRALPLAVGVVRRAAEGHVARDVPSTWLSYWEPPQGPAGEMACGVVLEREGARYLEEEGHFLFVTDHPSDQPFVYHAGGAWSRGLDFHRPDDWSLYLAAFARRLSAPLAIRIDAP